ncbi:LANO_0G11914g1_1 [Lachancea nothofagi CBS 11611]|uniref:E3 ubiquitin protein ligase n=1 Tax=Lachancea nothofagi CBS 11611 TaxID=1266666 RepID=A0A1G4KJI3_9SACH|nr:LANO_0G11914g1_1 [Lachancea nothofagi CBS 11611]
MSDEPVVKRAKLDWKLTDSAEPLTRKDVIAFQKEALFRALNRHRTRAESLETQLRKGHESLAGVREQYARVCATLAVLAAKLAGFCVDEPEAQKLCQSVIQGVDTDVSLVADQLSALVDRYVGQTTKDPGLASHLHALEKTKQELSTHNVQLQQELDAVRDHYQTLVRRYDRQDSETVKRVFKLKTDKSSDNTATSEPHGSSQSSEINHNEAEKKTDAGQTGKVNDEKDDQVPQFEHELRVQELGDQIETLRSTIQDLESWKLKREGEILKLRTELVSSANSHHEQHPANDFDRDHILHRLDTLTQENASLAHANEAFLSKFQQLVQDKEIFTNKLATEFQTAQDALKKHNAMLEKDLVRIRSTRDEMAGKMAIMENQKPKSEMLVDLQKVLDLQKERIENMENRQKETSKDALTKELQDLEHAFKDLTQLAHKKYSDQLAQESILTKLTVEKTKADQKYFAAMRSKDSILIENKNLTKNLNKSNELIAQLKEIERTLQSKIESLNKQIHLHENNEKRLLDANKNTSMKLMDLTSALAKSKKIVESSNVEKSKSVEQITMLESQVNSLQTEAKALKLQLTQAESKASKLHKSLVSNGGHDGTVIAEELENFRTIVYCSLCSKNWKNTAIKTCGHVFCDQCCKERLAARMRKCPICRMPFGSHDVLDLHM